MSSIIKRFLTANTSSPVVRGEKMGAQGRPIIMSYARAVFTEYELEDGQTFLLTNAQASQVKGRVNWWRP